MSDLSPVIVNGIGSPRAWLFTNSGEPIRDFDEQIIAKFLNKFNYTYNEEEDDECKLTFMFPSLRSFDLPYFQQDVILNVEWGYVTTGGDIIKSPRRKVAIRDMESNYKKDGIELVLKCTDLASYLKGMKTQRVNKYRKEPTSNTTPEGRIQNGLAAELEDLFYNDVLNGTGHNVSITKVEGNKTTVINKKGEVKVGFKNPSTNKYKPAKPNKVLPFQGGYNKIVQGGVIENRALINLGNTSYDKAIKIKLKWENKLNVLGSTNDPSSLDDSDGPKIKDGTDDNIQIKTRDFNQPIFKQYTYYGGSGELLSFKSNTETRKQKENKTISSGIDPYSKKVISHEVDTTDSKPLPKKLTVAQGLTQTTKEEIGKPTRDLMIQVFNDQKKAFLEAPKQLDSKIKATNKYVQNQRDYKPNAQHYMGYKAYSDVVTTFTAAEIMATPEFKDIAREFRNPALKNYDSSGRGSGFRKVLTGYSIESIQRKYTATAEVIGDPSLIKGRVMLFNNLGRLDVGKWYSTSVEHSIDIDSGYICNIGLMKNPKPIGISAKTYSANPKYDRVSGDITMEGDIDIKEGIIYEQKDEDREANLDNMDSIEQEKRFREEGIVDGMNNRLDFLKAEDDSFDELANNEEFTFGILPDTINKPQSNSNQL